jgi:HSP20 family protein
MGDTLTIRGERKQESKTQNGGRHRIERVHGTFERSFVLDRPMRGDQVKAQVKDGVLEVRVPKAEEARLREIEVQVA